MLELLLVALADGNVPPLNRHHHVCLSAKTPASWVHSARIALTHYARATLSERADAMRKVPTPCYEDEDSD